jgi:putative colanic acid biosynthesis acetyltransferase WcaF
LQSDRPPGTQAATQSESARSARHEWRLRDFSGSGYDKQRGVVAQVLWFATLNLVFRAWWYPARWRPALLRAFGAKVGTNVLIRHRVRVLWPWKLRVGNDTWIGEDAWLLNLEPIEIGNDVCISQGAYLCTGSHDRLSPSFEFDNASIVIDDQTWIATQALVLRGVTVSPRSVVGARAIVTRDVPENSIVPAGSVW